MTIDEAQQEIIDEFAMYDDWMDRYNHLIEMGRSLPKMSPSQKTKDNLIEGCQSRVWLHAGLKDGKVVFNADSDALITKGIAALLVRVLSDQPPGEVAHADLRFIDEIGLKQNLSPTRSNGLVAMVKQMKLYGLAYQTKMEK